MEMMSGFPDRISTPHLNTLISSIQT